MVLYGKKKEHVFLNNLPNFRDLSYSSMEPIVFLLTEPKDMKSKKQKLKVISPL